VSLIALLLAAAAPAQTSIDAERDFAAMAQVKGQWTAFRAYAAPDAIMFDPGPKNAQALLADLPNPPVSVIWWPGRSWLACDGSLAVNTGPWIRRGGQSTGTFTTVWQRQADGGWKWLLDQGRQTPRAVSASDRPKIARASCRNLAATSAAKVDPGRLSPAFLYQAENAMPAGRRPEAPAVETGRVAGGASRDSSLVWRVDGVTGAEGAHLLRVWLWDGRAYRLALEEIKAGD
jgi:hypothetical protein